MRTGETWQMRDAWPVARLIPAVKLRSESELECRVASVLLAVMRAVPSFGTALLKEAGLKPPKGSIRTYTELPLTLEDERNVRPDGVVVVERGKTRWSCLVEVKVNRAELTKEQIECYLDAARQHGFDAVLTISNRIVRSGDDSPVEVDKRKLRTTQLAHMSWWRILTEAVLEHRHRGVDDPDQAWILGELISYLDHDNSGTGNFDGMGQHWTPIRNAARQGTLRATDKGIKDVVAHFEQFTDYLALSLAQDLGCDVTPFRQKGVTRNDRIDMEARELAEAGTLEAILKIPDTAGPLHIVADLRAKRTTVFTTVKAPDDGRAATRVNWLLRQLKDAPGSLRIDVQFERTRETASLLLDEARQNPKGLLCHGDPKRCPKSFTIAFGRAMGFKGGRGPKSFIGETRKQSVEFYQEVLQRLHPWQPSAPKLAATPDDSDGATVNGTSDVTPPEVSSERIWYMPATTE